MSCFAVKIVTIFRISGTVIIYNRTSFLKWLTPIMHTVCLQQNTCILDVLTLALYIKLPCVSLYNPTNSTTTARPKFYTEYEKGLHGWQSSDALITVILKVALK